MRKICHIIKQPKENGMELERNGILVFAISMVGSISNMLFQFFAARYMTVGSYGELNALISLTTMMGIVASVLSNVAVKYTAIHGGTGDFARAKGLHCGLQIVAAACSLILLVTIVACSTFLTGLFHLSDGSVFFISAISCFSMFAVIESGFLQGLQQYTKASFANTLSLLGKFVFSVVMFFLGFQLFGALIAILMGHLLALGYSLFSLRKYFGGITPNWPKRSDWYDMLIRFGGGTLVTQFCASLLSGGDLLLVNYYFSREQAGIYASAVTFGKIGTYLINALVFVLLPTVAVDTAKGEKTKNYYFRTLVYTGVISGGIALIIKPVFSWVVVPIFGEAYAVAAQYIIPVVVLMIPISLISLTIGYQMGKGQLKFVNGSVLCGLIGAIVCAAFLHASIEQMLYSLTVVMSFTALLNIAYVICAKEENETGHDRKEKRYNEECDSD